MAQAVQQSLLAAQHLLTAERASTQDVRGAGEKLCTVKEPCERLGGISNETLRQLRKKGKIKFVRVGNRPLFPASEIEAFISRSLRRWRAYKVENEASILAF